MAFKDFGLYSFQKTTTVLMMLAYDVTTDFRDEYLKIGEMTALKSLKYFCQSNCFNFFKAYLRKPNDEDIARLLANW